MLVIPDNCRKKGSFIQLTSNNNKQVKKKMKQLKSNLKKLRIIFSQITIRYVAEFGLKKARGSEDGITVKNRMEEKDFDIMPVVRNNKIVGYVDRATLKEGACLEQIEKIVPGDLLAESTRILDALVLFKDRRWFFVLEGNKIEGIVTKGDLRKTPVRMYFFMLVNLLEMHLTRLIRTFCSEEELEQLIGDKRMEKAQGEFEKREKDNESIDIFDCLQFCDKRVVALKTKRIYDLIEEGLKKNTERNFKRFEQLRNNLCHAQDIIDKMSWEKVIHSAELMEKMIKKLETKS